jgi:hypothetical protein
MARARARVWIIRGVVVMGRHSVDWRADGMWYNWLNACVCLLGVPAWNRRNKIMIWLCTNRIAASRVQKWPDTQARLATTDHHNNIRRHDGALFVVVVFVRLTKLTPVTLVTFEQDTCVPEVYLSRPCSWLEHKLVFISTNPIQPLDEIKSLLYSANILRVMCALLTSPSVGRRTLLRALV